jgi:GNAT superfamily N-acetyltransferase
VPESVVCCSVIRSLQLADVDACAAVLDRLPEWFGMPQANATYVEGLKRLPGFVAEVDGTVVGFIAMTRHAPESAEITVMAVEPTRHRQGFGHALVAAAEAWCRSERVQWLHVKTRGPSTFDDDYERTRRFYLAEGFAPLYESLTEWGPANAALVLVKHLVCAPPPVAKAPI